MTDEREAQLLEAIARRDELLARQGDELAALKSEIRFLNEKIDALVKRVFGSSSEQMNSAQLELEGLLAEGKVMPEKRGLPLRPAGRMPGASSMRPKITIEPS